LKGTSKVCKSLENINNLEQKLSQKDIIDYVFERFEEVKKSNQIKDLVSFQAMNKHMIMAHNQNELKILGNIVASNKKIKFSEILEEYEKHLKVALETEPTTKTHSNVILHIFGFFSKDFSQQEKEKFFELFEINPTIYRFNNTYLASQTYFLLYSNPEEGNLFKLLSK
jgi:uncharacterized protein YbgA (DUF1722 family)